MKGKARERGTVNQRAEADGHPSAILSLRPRTLASECPLRWVPSLWRGVCRRWRPRRPAPRWPTRPSPCLSLGRGPPGTSGTGKTSGPGTASAGWWGSRCRRRWAGPTWTRHWGGVAGRRAQHYSGGTGRPPAPPRGRSEPAVAALSDSPPWSQQAPPQYPFAGSVRSLIQSYELSRPQVHPSKMPAQAWCARRKFRPEKQAGDNRFRSERASGSHWDPRFQLRPNPWHGPGPGPSPGQKRRLDGERVHSTCFYYKTTEHTRKIHHPVITSKAQIFEKKRKIFFIKLYD